MYNGGVPSPIATLLPLTSLAGFVGAKNFLKWLYKTNQQGWQMLPISGPITTPYRNQGIGIASFLYDQNLPKKYRTWLISYEEFLSDNQDWVLDFALFQALCEHYQNINWWQWPTEIASYQCQAVTAKRQELAGRIEVYLQEQYFLTNQFLHLKKLAKEYQQLLIGDLPFYLAQESSLVWSHQHLFMLPATGKLVLQSGVPADPGEPFTAQYWGHPLYNWASQTEEIIKLFNCRLKFLANFFDLVRLDHANGFFRYGMMSLTNPRWSKKVAGPGGAALEKVLSFAQNLNLGLYFEDTASENMQLQQFMKKHSIAGVDIFTLNYNTDLPNCQQQLLTKLKFPPKSSRSQVIYSSTHDTLPLLPWVKSLPENYRQQLALSNQLPTNLSAKQFALCLREHVLALPARLIIIPWQDWQLEEWRFNTPGNEKLTNWNYQVAIENYL